MQQNYSLKLSLWENPQRQTIEQQRTNLMQDHTEC